MLDGSRPAAPALLVLSGAAAGQRIRLAPGRPSVLGRSREADVCFPDEPSLSRLHVRIDQRDGHYLLTDLGSVNGTSVNGETLTEPAGLRDGDLLRCGALELRFEVSAEPARSRKTGGASTGRRSRTVALPDALAAVPLFRRLSFEELAAVAGAMTERRFDAGEPIVVQGEDGEALYVVLAGRVRVERTAPPGDVIELASLGPGGFFGEMTLLDGQPRSATVLAVSAVRCALLPRSALDSLIRAHPAMAMQLLAVLSTRLRAVERRLTE